MKNIMLITTLAAAITASAGDIALPPANKTGGKPLMDALAARQSQRAYADKELSLQTLSDLLWAANGVNRPDGRRTAPTARNNSEIDVYALTKDGAFLYTPATHSLSQVNTNDLRTTSGLPGFAQNAPVTLVLVVNRAKQGAGAGNKMSDRYAAVDSGYISQNIYLYAASEGLSSVVLGTLNAAALFTSLKLDENSEALFAQPVGYPK
jgi:SagB-type dehydrogenase family enzyme